jgi:cellulose synthase operon protein C
MTTTKSVCAVCGALLAAASVMLSLPAAHASEAASEAKAYLEKGDERAARIVLKDALQRDPNDVEARLLLGKIHLDARDGAAAEKELRRAAELQADPARWRLPLAEALLLQGRFSDALDRLESAEELAPADQAQAAALRGDAQLGLKRLEEAEQAYAAALALDADNARAAFGQVRPRPLPRGHRGGDRRDGCLPDTPPGRRRGPDPPR